MISSGKDWKITCGNGTSTVKWSLDSIEKSKEVIRRHSIRSALLLDRKNLREVVNVTPEKSLDMLREKLKEFER